MSQPTNADIQEAINSLAAAYHTFVQALTAREEEERRQKQNDRHERRELKTRLDAFFGRLDFMEKKIDRQFDQRDKEFDAFKEETERRLAALEEAREVARGAADNGR
jgi:hypothetical protein